MHVNIELFVCLSCGITVILLNTISSNVTA